ncbi:MAG: hypothetical protein HQL35_01540 [Alphaproteobacteria bacterium]|nr:hypothetical protein [Alphaproteobacteria bacterium]
MEKEYQKLEKNKALIDSFHTELISNATRLETMTNTVGEAIDAFSAGDDDTNLTAAEVETLSAKITKVADDVERLLITIHPDIVQTDIIRDVKNYLTTLRNMAPVEGVVDPEGTDPGAATNANREILDTLGTFKTLVETAYEVTSVTKENASDISLTLSANLATKLSDMTQLSNVELARREAEIEDIKAHYANILRVISLSFEARMSANEQLSKSLEGGQIEPGSIMNLFT